MKKGIAIARYLLGFLFVVFGLNGFFNFIPLPPMEGLSQQFMGALFQSHYLYAVKAFEIVGGVLLLADIAVPFALCLLAPVVVNIFFFHVFLDQNGLPMGILLLLIQGFLVYSYRKYFMSLLEIKAKI